MSDIWSFLLQTLTASGVAAVLLAVKWMLRDKLFPRWQFAVWGVLGLVLVVPAGMGGRYALVNWPFFVEFLRSLLTGAFGVLTRVTVPVPLPRFDGIPRTGAEWVCAVYLAGAALLLGRYALSYLRLRLALRRGTPAGEGRTALIRETAERYGLPVCPAVEVPGLDSAMICGVLRPVLALPAEEETDEKVLLHELLHLKHRDTAWAS